MKMLRKPNIDVKSDEGHVNLTQYQIQWSLETEIRIDILIACKEKLKQVSIVNKIAWILFYVQRYSLFVIESTDQDWVK